LNFCIQKPPSEHIFWSSIFSWQRCDELAWRVLLWITLLNRRSFHVHSSDSSKLPRRGEAVTQFVAPMMASSVKEPFNDPDWIFETKLDGYRAIAVIDSTGKARLWSRNHLPLEPKFPTIGDGANQLKLRSTILDGEIVALDKNGIPRFQLLQQWQKRPTAPVVYVLFDLPWDNGRDLTGKSVVHRRKRLQEIITAVDGIQVGGYVEGRGKALFQLAKEKRT
jgi:bifunctional non-homologous end joining protein LigD